LIEWTGLIAAIVWVVFMCAGGGLEAHRFIKGTKSYKTLDQVDAAMKRHRLAMVCFLISAVGAFFSDNLIFGINVIIFGIILNEGTNDLGKHRQKIEEKQRKAREQAAMDADRTAAELGLSPEALAGIDPDVLAEIQRSMREAQPVSVENMTDAERAAYWRAQALKGEQKAKDR
jgi:hypothetical protein